MPEHLNRRLSPTRRNYPEQTLELDEISNSKRKLHPVVTTCAFQTFESKVVVQLDRPAPD